MPSRVAVERLTLEMVRSLVDDKDRVRVTSTLVEGYRIVKVAVSPRDLGKVIGKQGKTARSLRTILLAAGQRDGSRCTLDIAEGHREVSDGEVPVA